MKVTVTCKLNPHKPGFVYATVESERGLEISATLDYALNACADRGWTITNAHDVLMWARNNVKFVGVDLD